MDINTGLIQPIIRP